MNSKISGNKGLRRAGALAVVAAVAALTAACSSGGGSSSTAAASTGSTTFQANLAFAHCMQTHGVPSFPDPNASQGFGVSGQLNGSATGPMAQAHNTCAHLLPRSSATTGTSSVTQSQLDTALKVVQCLRTNGVPTFPDPTVVGGSLHFTLGQGVLQSAQFQTALTACHSLIPKGVNFP